ncbi:MAG: hypothetical protein ABEJ59_04915 [Halanaeroarchaeum sp.]
MPSRIASAAVGVLASLALSALLWKAFGTPFVFLFVPIVPFLFGRSANRPPARTCPECGFETRDSDVAYCPYDGTPLETDELSPRR